MEDFEAQACNFRLDALTEATAKELELKSKV